MSFESLQNNQASEKFYLIRMEPTRHINSLLTSIGGGLYTMTFDFNLSKIEEDGSGLTKVSGIPLINQYSYDINTKLLTIYPSNYSDNIICAFYYLFYTGAKFRTVGENPEIDANLKDWEPKLKNNPSIGLSISNVLTGQLSISGASVTIINDNYDFHGYLTDNDSFYQKEILIWQCLDSTENIKKAYQGRMIDVKNIKSDSVSIGFENIFTAFSDSCVLGDEYGEVYHSLQDNPNLDPAKNGVPIPFIFGTASRYKTIPETITNLPEAQKLDPNFLNESVCIDYSNEILTNKNRKWSTCRYDSIYSMSETLTTIDNTDPNFTRAITTKNYLIGDTIHISQSGNHYYVRIYYVDTVTNYMYFTKTAAITTGALAVGSTLSIVITDGTTNWYMHNQVDFNMQLVVTSGGHNSFTITFFNNFESAHSGLIVLDPSIHQVHYRARPVPKKHGATLKFLLNKLGLSIKTSTFDDADTLLPVNTNFSIPSFDSEDYGEYYEYIEKILESTLGFLRINEDFEFEYHLFDSPSSTSEINDTDIIKKTYSVNIDYNDLIYQFIAYNPHCNASEFIDNSSASSKTKKVKYLHNSQKTVRFQHVLEDISTRISKHAGLRAERKALYKFSTKVKNLTSLLGDEFLLKKDGILGNDAEKNITLLDMNKSTNTVNATYQDLKGL